MVEKSAYAEKFAYAERKRFDMKNNERGFCIFYDWLDVFETMSREDVGDIVLAIGRYYTDGVKDFEGLSQVALPVATMMYMQIKRAEERASRNLSFKRIRTEAVSEVTSEAVDERKIEAKAETYTDAETETKTKTKTDTETDAETETETETEKTKETKQNPHARACEARSYGSREVGGDEVGGVGKSKQYEASSFGLVAVRPLPTLEEVERYIRDNRLSGVQPRHFYEYNTRRGWAIDGKPIRDWQSVINFWNRLSFAPIKEEKAPERSRYGSFDVDEAFEKALRRSYGDEKYDSRFCSA